MRNPLIRKEARELIRDVAEGRVDMVKTFGDGDDSNRFVTMEEVIKALCAVVKK